MKINKSCKLIIKIVINNNKTIMILILIKVLGILFKPSIKN